MTTGIKFIETDNHDDFCSQLYDAVKGYEDMGYETEIKPQVLERTGEFGDTGLVYTALVIGANKSRKRRAADAS